MIIKHIKFLLVCLVISLSIEAHAIQLGKVIFQSNQNAPLDVAIQVNLTSEDKIDLLKPSIAPKENYDSQGIERTKIHNDIALSLVSKKPNQATLRLTSKILVTEPFLDLLIQIESPSGKILKEYTVLLDPPLNIIPAKKVQEKEVTKKEPSMKNKKEKLKKVEIKKIAQKKLNTQTSKKKKTVIAKPGKTLFQIARENSIAGVTTEQIVIAIYQLNPKSFDGNLNGLIKGKKLKLPLNEYYKKLSHLEARKILKNENIAWKNIKRPKKLINKEIKNKVADELSRLKSELEIANKKLLEKNQALKEIQALNKSTIKPIQAQNKAPEIIFDAEVKQAQSKAPEIILDTFNEGNKVTAETLNKESSKPFISSITDQNQNIIQEVIIKDQENHNSIKPIFVLLLLFLLTLLIGLLLLVRQRKKEINTEHFSDLTDTFEPNDLSFKSDVEHNVQTNQSMKERIDDADLSNQSNINSVIDKDDESK